MKIYLCLVALGCAIIVLVLRAAALSWPLSLIGGLLAFSGVTILLLGCSVQRLLSEQREKPKQKNFFGLLAKGRGQRRD